MSGHGDQNDIPGPNPLRELAYGLAVGLGFGMLWKSWQWKDKADRVANNSKWSKQYPQWVEERRAALLENAEEETPDTPEDQPENEERPTAPDADANPVTQQPLPHQKLEEGKVIPSKVNQQDL